MRQGARDEAKATVVPVAFLFLGAWICVEALQVPVGSLRMPGAGFFPLLLGMTLSVMSISLLGMCLLNPVGSSTDLGPERSEVFYLVASMFAAVWLFERAGFLLTMILLAGVVMKVLGRMSWGTALVLAAMGSLAAYVVFSRVLQIALPSGILPF
jgi:putative tricarboxylic transport membrane protein